MRWLFMAMLIMGLISPAHSRTFSGSKNYLKDNAIRGISFSNKIMWCTYDKGVIRLDIDSGNTVTYAFMDGVESKRVTCSAIARNGVLWVGILGGGIASFNGQTWSSVQIPDSLGVSEANAITVDQLNNKWFGAIDGVIGFDGAAWKRLGRYSGVTAIFADSRNYLWCGGSDYLSCYAEGVWKKYEYGSDAVYLSMYEDKNHVFWFGYDGGVKSFDGITWKVYDRNSGADIKWVYAITSDRHGVKWFGTAWGLWSYDGKTWEWHTDGIIENTCIFDIEIDEEGYIWAASDKGLFRLDPRTAAYAGDAEDEKPLTMRITGIRPNPFNPYTAISFALAVSGRIELAVYDISGCKIRTLNSQYLNAGMHTSVWDGHDDSGRPVSSGIYFSRLSSGGRAATGKMLLVK